MTQLFYFIDNFGKFKFLELKNIDFNISTVMNKIIPMNTILILNVLFRDFVEDIILFEKVGFVRIIEKSKSSPFV